MKQKILHSSGVLAIMMLITAALSSCNNDRKELLSTVPFDSDYVVAIDLYRFAADCDITFDENGIKFPAGLKSFTDKIDSDDKEYIIGLSGAVDLHNIIAFGTVKHDNPFLTAKVTDADRLRDFIRKNNGERLSGMEMETYRSKGDIVVISDDEKQAWFFDDEELSEQTADYVLLDEKKSILRYSGVTDVLLGDGAVTYAVNLAVVQTSGAGYWCGGLLKVDDNAIVAEMKVMEPDGTAVGSDMLKTIDTDFLRYMPSNFVAAFAFGINSESNDYAKAVSQLSQFEKSGLTNEKTFDYIRSLDGTVAIGFGPTDKSAFTNPGPANWQMLIMAHMDQDKVNSLTEYAASLLPGSTEISAGRYTFRSGEVEMTYGNVDGNFAVAYGMPLKETGNNSFGGIFEGLRLAGVIQTPLLSSIGDLPKMNYSIKASLRLNGDTYVLTVSLVENDSPIVPTLVHDIPLIFDALSGAGSQAPAVSLESFGDAPVEEEEEVYEEVAAVDTGISVSMTGTAGSARFRSFNFTIDDYGQIYGTDSYGAGPLSLNGSYDPSTGKVTMTEEYGGKITGHITGTLTIRDSSASLTGQFTNYKGKTLPLNLHGTAMSI